LNKSELVHVGTFGSPSGLKGEIKINVLTTSFDIFKSLDLYINFDESTQWKFKKMLINNSKCIAHPIGSNNRDDAEKLRNQKIYSFINKFPKIKSNEFYVKDLLKCQIFLPDGQLLGNVISVDNFGAGDLLETKYGDKNIYIPMNRDNLINIDLKKKVIVVDPIKGILD